jgi:hypothetical protein
MDTTWLPGVAFDPNRGCSNDWFVVEAGWLKTGIL